jgi:hypothetical protein
MRWSQPVVAGPDITNLQCLACLPRSVIINEGEAGDAFDGLKSTLSPVPSCIVQIETVPLVGPSYSMRVFSRPR